MAHPIRTSHWRTVHKQLLWAYQGAVDPEFRQCEVTAYHYSLWYLLAGKVIVRTTDAEIEARSGGWLLLPPCDHEQVFSEASDLLSIRFMLLGPASEALLKVDEPCPLYPRTERLKRSALRLVRLTEERFGHHRNRLESALGSPIQHLELEAHFQLLLRELFLVTDQAGIELSNFGQIDGRIQTCLLKVRQAPHRRWTSTGMATSAGLSMGHFNRLFHQSLGMSPQTWLDNERLTNARAQLLTDALIKEIAYSLGFSSSQHFATWFRKHTGQTPKAFRESDGRRPR